jgi:hypothetical protein
LQTPTSFGNYFYALRVNDDKKRNSATSQHTKQQNRYGEIKRSVTGIAI